MTLWERFEKKIHNNVWWRLTLTEWNNRDLRKENKELQEKLMRLTLTLEKYIKEK